MTNAIEVETYATTIGLVRIVTCEKSGGNEGEHEVKTKPLCRKNAGICKHIFLDLAESHPSD